MRRTFVLAMVAMIGLSACSQGAGNVGNKEVLGGLGGAAVGGLAGSQIGKGKGQLVAVGAGVLIGALLGTSIGRSLDKADRLHVAQTAGTALEQNQTGQQSSWSNPDSGNSGSITPTRTTYNTTGQPCREYQQTIVVGGKTQSGYGTACRDANGDWRIVRD